MQLELDQEWVNLILKAKQLGLTIEEIREFLQRELDNENRQKTG